MEPQGSPFLTSRDFKRMITMAGQLIEGKKDILNRLNVFPVPDGDTGTNISLTLSAATAACGAYRGSSVGELAGLVAAHTLMGARGNSGVIFSQLLRGLARGLKNQAVAGPLRLGEAWQQGVAYAYRAVLQPVEGTILTVARRAADGAWRAALSGAGIEGILEGAFLEAKKALQLTTEMLPALRQAGVVDAGGAGLVLFLQGCLLALRFPSLERSAAMEMEPPAALAEQAAARSVAIDLDLQYPYCTELFVDCSASNKATGDLKDLLSRLGDSLLLVRQAGLLKIHLHTADPDGVVSACTAFGPVSQVKVTYMPDQYQPEADNTPVSNVTAAGRPHPKPLAGEKRVAVIALAGGEGLERLFYSLGADVVVPGGPAMNTRVADLLAAVNRAPSEEVIILANNSNIIPAARQVGQIPTRAVAAPRIENVPQGLAALLAFRPSAGLAENVAAMEAAAERIKCGEIAVAVRDTIIDGISVKNNDILGLADGKAICTGKDHTGVILALLDHMVEEGDEILTLIYGEDVSPATAEAVAERVMQVHPGLEVELQEGGQPVYHYYIYLE